MPTNNNNDWQKHLDELEEHYNPDNFFYDQLYKPTNEPDVREHFFAPALAESKEIPEEGQLTVDIAQDENNLYLITPLAGVKSEDIEISVEGDIVTIRGERSHETNLREKELIYQECYWGGFSRSVIIPTPIQEDKVAADLKNGVLTITMPKKEATRKVDIRVNEEME